MKTKSVIVIGAGFGGLWAVRTLSGTPCDTLVMDRNNYHTFLALLYQVAAAELEAEDIAYPVRSIFGKFPAVDFALAHARRARGIDGPLVERLPDDAVERGRVVDEDIDAAAPLVRDLRGSCLAGREIGDIAADAEGRAARRRDLVGGAAGAGLVHIEHRDACALLRVPRADRAADAARPRGAGNDGHPVAETLVGVRLQLHRR